MKKAMLLSLALMMGVGNVALAQQCTDLIDVRMNNAVGEPLMMGQIITVCATITVGHEFGYNGPGYMQDATGAVAIYSGDAFGGSDHEIGDVVEVLAEVGFYRGLTQMRYASSIVVTDTGDFIAPLALDLATFFADPEFYEARLVRFTGVTLSASSNWPAEGSDSNMTIEQGAYSLTMRVDKDTDIDGSTAPGAAFDVSGIISQYDSSSPYDEGYQIMPRMLNDFDFGGVVDADTQPADFQLLGAFPNPFNPTTTIEFTLNTTQNVHLSVLDIMGREVAVLSSGMTESGTHQVAFDGAHLSSGLYFTCLQGESQMQVSKMMLIK